MNKPETLPPAVLKLIVDAMDRIDFRAARGALISIRDLRHGMQLPTCCMRDLLLAGARDGHFSLHQHDYPSSLTPAQLSEMIVVPDGSRWGVVYCGVAIRQSR